MIYAGVSDCLGLGFQASSCSNFRVSTVGLSTDQYHFEVGSVAALGIRDHNIGNYKGPYVPTLLKVSSVSVSS